ncbi:MAG: hypothetical protein JW850_00975 [Thermoflexales bacterium]|nr:hypothetical protein [Thermoflexales bacterium]
MSLLKSCPITEAEIDSDWKVLCTIGGVATMILIVYSLVTMVSVVVLGGAPGNAEEAFTLLQNNRLVGLARLDVLTVLVMPLYYLLFLGLYIALRRTRSAYTTLATVLVFVGLTLFLATPSAFSMLTLSDKHAAATTEAQRSQLLAAGEAILASDMFHSTGAFVGGVLLQSAAVLISVVMLWSAIFSKLTAYVGILTHGLDLLHIPLLILAPPAGVFLMAIAGTLYLLWFPLVGWRLWQLGRREKQLPS